MDICVVDRMLDTRSAPIGRSDALNATIVKSLLEDCV